MALKEYPMLNSRITEQGVENRKSINIGIAVDTDNGLMVPNVKNCDKKSIPDIAKEIMDLAVRARAKKLKVDEITGGSTTLTNVGSFGAVSGTAIINHPEVSIFMVNAIADRMAIEKKKAVVKKVLPLNLTFDHRLIDCADAGRVLHFVSEYLNSKEIEVK